ncbi:4Fe-4S dicluster domain-containing protein [Heliophilum fasciatum]|uniref:2-oxoglutarate ferredoxin oxidoreductase subunit delta n=1 Tax=Heliophilum fasciatum TaxID=35700 RepID=A0A4R2SBD3_9FIRM|nr:4Fe-4S dicluster domain-containing protein [Heliophilum fasciatum]MCW2276979.1 2-oxoglutarate ferredoxin oxidoreductase subunit delta [Heliophilum fasciatum]TCP68495.1 2-oxoglutarate ferredoxin oxidoreductase subunit delta [Heliophilum fasciatum]
MKTWKAYVIESGKGKHHVFPGLCKGCGLCIEKCPTKTIRWSYNLGVYGTPIVEVQQDPECIACGICQNVCPDTAIVVERLAKAKEQGKEKEKQVN